MRRFALSPLTVILALALVTTAPQQSAPVAAQASQAQAPIPQPPPPAATADPVQDSAQSLQGPGRPRSHRLGGDAAAAESDQHRHRRDGRIWVAEGVRYRSHHARQPEGDRIVVLQDKDGDGTAESVAHVRAGAGAHRAARRLGHRQQDRRRAAAGPHRLHRRRSQPALRSGGRQARGAADRLPRHQPRPLAALGDGRAGRQVGVQRRQHRRDVHGQVGQDVPRLRPVPRRARSVRSSTRTTPRRSPASRATTGTSTSAASRSG